MEQRQSVLLIDHENLAHRAFHATYKPDRPVMNFEGFPTNAFPVWVNMINSLINEFKPYYVLFVLDNQSIFRKTLYPPYKENRKEKPEPLKQQLPILREMAKNCGFQYIEESTEEADDLMASAIKRLKADFLCLIASSDKDFGQLITPRVRQIKPEPKASWRVWSPIDIVEKLGVAPMNVARYLALVKDTVDNIPGIAGIGPVTAVEMLADNPSDEVLIQRIAKKKKIDMRDATTAFYLNYQLTKLREVPFTIKQGGSSAPDILRKYNCIKASETFDRLIRAHANKTESLPV